MMINTQSLETGILLKMIPGPDRKREPAIYSYHLTYRSPETKTPGCVMTWEVLGGRMEYQVALERRDDGALAWHCTCADSVFRGDLIRGHRCKHVRGIMQCTPVETVA